MTPDHTPTESERQLQKMLDETTALASRLVSIAEKMRSSYLRHPGQTLVTMTRDAFEANIELIRLMAETIENYRIGLEQFRDGLNQTISEAIREVMQVSTDSQKPPEQK